ALLADAAGTRFERRLLRDLLRSPGKPALVIMHAAAERPATVERVGKIKAAVPGVRVILVVHRHQASQISYAIEAGVHRCMVEPILRGELAVLLSRLDEE
ncbi:MAG: hypothetical protein HYZ27_10805, partial [Deltaproteobacteria bacterium]|nr:hypothetical protein [Deltaproteobacteria bacterium]